MCNINPTCVYVITENQRASHPIKTAAIALGLDHIAATLPPRGRRMGNAFRIAPNLPRCMVGVCLLHV